MSKYKFQINKNQYEVEISNIDDNIADVLVNGTSYKVEVDKSLQTTKTPKLVRTVAVPSTDASPQTAKTSSPSAPKGSGVVKSPLPGIILNIYVNVGDSVSIGQKIITLEAMKMENNINSDKEGKVTNIKVKKGDAVMEGDVLVEIN
ncbi:MAG: biotin/lipoyl-binding protein [Bacteroidales bacterium]|jgi:biotin carboxyl carrier protein|nr:biotin/lipoyl-binding protein [Bacteroidales bacterium]MDD4213816.1 biotin/lipoyl-binding protein [Bacteroidales bacterium]